MQHNLLDFLKRLKNNNNRDWFAQHRHEFETAKNEFTLLVEKLISGIGKLDTDIKTLEAKDCIFRQYRDIRFSSDKTPYKTHIGAYMNRGGKKINTAGYYIHIEPGKSIIAGGLYQPDGEQLRKVRQEIDYNFEEWKSITSTKAFRAEFPDGVSREDTLKRLTRGYDTDNPAAELMKLKSFVFQKPLRDADLAVLHDEKSLIKTFSALSPVIKFLNRAGDI